MLRSPTLSDVIFKIIIVEVRVSVELFIKKNMFQERERQGSELEDKISQIN